MVMRWPPEAPFTIVLHSNVSWAVSAERAERCSSMGSSEAGCSAHGGKGAVPMYRAELSVLGAQQKPAGSYSKGLIWTLGMWTQF